MYLFLREIQLFFLPNLKPHIPSHVTFRSLLWIGLGVAVWIVIDGMALKTELSGEVNGLVHELSENRFEEAAVVNTYEISASRSNLIFGKKIGKIALHLEQETSEGIQQATRFYYYEKVGDRWNPLGAVQYL